MKNGCTLANVANMNFRTACGKEAEAVAAAAAAAAACLRRSFTETSSNWQEVKEPASGAAKAELASLASSPQAAKVESNLQGLPS